MTNLSMYCLTLKPENEIKISELKYIPVGLGTENFTKNFYSDKSGESIGILYGYFSVNLPAEGLKFYKDPQVILFVFWQLILFTILFRRFGFYVIHQKGNFNLKKWTFHILFSYFIIQGAFEPDLGSSVRHKIGVLPLIYYAIFIKRLHEK